MSFDVTAFTDYVNEQSTDLLTRSLTGAQSAALFNIQTGVKSSADLHIFTTDAIFQAGGACSRTASGTTTFTKRNITVGKIQVAEDLCPKDLEAKWTQIMLPNGSVYEDINFFATEYFGKKADTIANQLETAIWTGDTTSGNANLSRFDGLLKLIDADATVVSATASTINETNIRTILRNIKDNLPDQIRDKDDVKVLCGWDTFDTYVNKLAIDNLFHKSGEGGEMGEMSIENSRVVLKAVNGLTGTNRIIAGRMSNFYIGVDMQDEEDNFETWYSQDDRNVKFNVEFKYGTQYAFGDEIVEYTNV